MQSTKCAHPRGLFAALAPLAVALVVGAAGRAQSAAAQSAYLDFQRDHGGAWTVAWHEPTGTPRAIYGNGVPLADWRENTLAEARRHALLALDRWPELLGLGASDWREVIGARMGRSWTFTFEQAFRGLPVVDGRVDVRVHMSGKIVHLGIPALLLPADFDALPKLGADEATIAAWAAVAAEPQTTPQPGKQKAARLVIVGRADGGGRAQPALAWEVQIRAVDSDGQGPIGRAFVDARTGALLEYRNDKHECGFAGCGLAHAEAAAPAPLAIPVPTTVTVRGWCRTGVSPVSAPVLVTLPGVEVNVPGYGVFVTDQNGQFTVDLAASVQITVRCDGVHTSLIQGGNAATRNATLNPGTAATVTLAGSGSSANVLAHTTTLWWVSRVNEFTRGVLGDTPQLDTADDVVPTVNLASTCNAYYTNNSINFYAAGGGCNNTAGASVIAHEWGHGLDDLHGGISQTNGLSEGWGDIVSMYLLDDATVGHDFTTTGGIIRTGNNNQQYPGGSGVHAQGQSWMGFAWKFRQNLRSALGTAQAVQVSNDVVLASIAANAQNQADAVVAAFQADDDDGVLGNGTPHYSQLAAACNSHSLPYPQLQSGALTAASVPNTRDQLLAQRVTLTASPYTGAYTQLRAHWQAGASQGQVAMIPTGAANEWQALLPGRLAPAIVQYHFEAVHSGGMTQRLPEAGEFQYLVQSERRIWIEDFEGGGAGWTHGASAGVDEWQIGAPAGRTGIGWADPSVAASGVACAGTDLGIPGDGAYSTASDTWLRSPAIDCSGQTGVRLRLKRQISCTGPSDALDIRVNGQLVWLSPFVTTAETAWSTFELVLPQADNQPAVTLEFRQRSAGTFPAGGWNLDDVELFSLDYAVPQPASFTITPEQAPQGALVTMQVGTPGFAPYLVVFGDTAGPTVLPGLGMLQVGGAMFDYFDFTDLSGAATLSFNAPAAPLTGLPLRAQMLTLDAQGEVILSNPWRGLFTQ
jgi:hypothetical protein